MAASQVLSPRACLEAGQISSAGGLSRRATFQEDETYEAKVARLASPLQRLLLPVAPTALLAKQGSVKFGGNYGVPDSVELYGIHGWGAPYFSVSAGGNLVVSPLGDHGPTLDLYQMVQETAAQGLHTPVVFRFLDILGHRMGMLNAAFDAAIRRFEYPGQYRGVFPVKCNHDREVIRSIVEYGQEHGFGLEVGSKAELVMVMSILAGCPPGVNLVCNGFKDEEYMELVLRCRQLGINAMVVMEQFSELDILLGVARRLGVRPGIGIRAKLTTRHGGHWGSTSGDKAKFGLRAREIVAVVNTLAEEGMLDCLQLLHFHCGSQITNIRMVKEVMREASFLYAELVQMGANMRFMDVGGGLAIDYDGSFTDSTASMSYTVQHYANDVTSMIMEACIQRNIPAPTIMSESGRALASHHAIVVFDVLTRPEHEDAKQEKKDEQEEVVDSIEIRDDRTLTKQLRAAAASGKGRFLLMTFKEVFDNISPDALALREAYNDASYFKEEAVRAFKLGVLSLEERAQVDMMFDATCDRIREVAHENELPLPDALRPDAVPRTKMYHVNLSIFRSAVDSWAIQQVFPICPIHRLHEEPTVAATLADLTCDSDGKIDRFINPKGGEPLPALALHEVKVGERYYLALFLSGVYQDVMGSVHNMFGSLNQVVVRAREGRFGAGCHGRTSAAAASSDSLAAMFTDDTYSAASSLCAAHDLCSTGSGDVDSGMWGRAGYGVGAFDFEHVVRGETVGEVLGRANHSAGDMLCGVQAAVDAAVEEGRMEPEEAGRFMDCYRSRMGGYTYCKMV